MHVLHARAHAPSGYASAWVCIKEYVSLRPGIHALHPIPPFVFVLVCAPETMPLLPRSISRPPKSPHCNQCCASGNRILRGRLVHWVLWKKKLLVAKTCITSGHKRSTLCLGFLQLAYKMEHANQQRQTRKKNKREIFIFTKIRNVDKWVFLLSLCSQMWKGILCGTLKLKCYSVASGFHHFSCW